MPQTIRESRDRGGCASRGQAKGADSRSAPTHGSVFPDPVLRSVFHIAFMFSPSRCPESTNSGNVTSAIAELTTNVEARTASPEKTASTAVRQLLLMCFYPAEFFGVFIFFPGDEASDDRSCLIHVAVGIDPIRSSCLYLFPAPEPCQVFISELILNVLRRWFNVSFVETDRPQRHFFPEKDLCHEGDVVDVICLETFVSRESRINVFWS